MPFTESLVRSRRGSLPPSDRLQNESAATAESSAGHRSKGSTGQRRHQRGGSM